MTLFWAIGCTLIAAALFFLIPPLIGRSSLWGQRHDDSNLAVLRDQVRELEMDLAAGAIDDVHHRQALAELERRVIEERAILRRRNYAGHSKAMAFGVTLAVPLFTVPLYMTLGSPEALLATPMATQERPPRAPTRAQAEDQVRELRPYLEAHPDDAGAWARLARTYRVLGLHDEEALAIGQLLRLSTPDAQRFADYAEALGMSRGRSLLGEPESYIALALTLDPGNIKALSLAGSAAFERGAYVLAVGHWERILALVPEESPTARSVAYSVAQARARMAAEDSPAPPPPPAAAPALVGRVMLSPALASRVNADDPVYVFARAAQGPRTPVVMVRSRVADLPTVFRLDDSKAMNPALPLSAVPEVQVGARIARSGSALPAPGDLEGYAEVGHNNRRDLVVTIDTEVN